VPPPAVVLAAGAAGIAAAVEIGRGAFLAAAGLLVLKTVLDNADGQLARAAGRVSAFGRYLDSESDLVVNAALFAALGYAAGRPLLAALAFCSLTLVLSANFNLRRLYELEHGRPTEAMPAATGAAAALRRVYALVYAPQDRAIEAFVRRRLRGAGDAARHAYHDRATIAILHNLGLTTQLTVLALCLAFSRPELGLWLAIGGGALLAPLELRRGLLATTPAPAQI
jgi:archaetidylinositol phosphate synthase